MESVNNALLQLQNIGGNKYPKVPQPQSPKSRAFDAIMERKLG